jgi:hypothetical protein
MTSGFTRSKSPAPLQLFYRNAAVTQTSTALYLAGVSGIDDAVVPQPRGGVERMALLLVLGQDGLLEGGLLLGSPRVACPHVLQ